MQSGTLKQKPLAEFMLLWHENHLSGSIELRSPDGREIILRILRGKITKVRSSDGDSYLGSILSDMCNIQPLQLAEVLTYAKANKKLIGTALVEAGLTTPSDIDKALHIQLERKLVRLFHLNENTSFKFYDEIDLLRDFGARSQVEANLYSVIWAGIKQNPPQQEIRECLAQLGELPLRLQNDGKIHFMKFTRTEQVLVDALLCGPMNKQDIIESCMIGDNLVGPFLYLLSITNLLKISHA